jgi:sugar-specific transcriptional regulator TrmB
MATAECIQALLSFGFTELEAEVYIYLLKDSPATGYRIAQAIVKPVANTYKALESLHNKGAILVDEGANRLCRAVPAEELLTRLERDFRRNRQRAVKALSALSSRRADDRVYQLRSREQVLERGRQMLVRAEQLAALDLFPSPLEELRSTLESTAARGVRVVLRAYHPVSVAGVEVFVDPHGASVLKRWPGQWANLVVDGQELLLAFLTSDHTGVHQALWSGSAYLAWLYYSSLRSELSLGELEHLLEEGATGAELRRAVERHRGIFKTDLPGYRKLLGRFFKPRKEPSDS